MNKELILVVEDHIKQNKILCDIVEGLGYTAIASFNGVEAFEQLRNHRRGLGFLSNKISCILLDWNMPEMNGEQFIKILRKEEHRHTFRKYLPVVIVSAYDEEEKKELAADSYFGMASAYITKPYKKSEIDNILNRIIRQNDSETLIEMNRENLLKKSPAQEEPDEKKLKILKEFSSGVNTEETLTYISTLKEQITFDYNTCLLSGNYDNQRLEFLQKLKILCDEEHKNVQMNLKYE